MLTKWYPVVEQWALFDYTPSQKHNAPYPNGLPRYKVDQNTFHHLFEYFDVGYLSYEYFPKSVYVRSDLTAQLLNHQAIINNQLTTLKVSGAGNTQIYDGSFPANTEILMPMLAFGDNYSITDSNGDQLKYRNNNGMIDLNTKKPTSQIAIGFNPPIIWLLAFLISALTWLTFVLRRIYSRYSLSNLGS
jgi:hypothetical protein